MGENWNRLEGSGNESTLRRNGPGALKRLWRTAAGRHTQTRDRRARHLTRAAFIAFFLDCLLVGGRSSYCWLCQCFFVVCLCRMPFIMGKDPSQLSRTWYNRALLLYLVTPYGKTWRSLIFHMVVVFGLIVLLSLYTCPRVDTLAALQTAGQVCVLLSCVHDYDTTTVLFVRCRQHSSRQPFFSSHELVIVVGTGGIQYDYS